MNIGILGTGMVGRAHAARLVDNGHNVMLGTRDPRLPGSHGDRLHGQSAPVRVAGFQSKRATRHVRSGGLVRRDRHPRHTRLGRARRPTAGRAGEPRRQNPHRHRRPHPVSEGGESTLFVCGTDSLGERIQRLLPQTKVVKTLNTVAAGVQVDPALAAGGDHHVFVGGNDAQAKADVVCFLEEQYGWQHVIDLGDITSARAAEMLLPMWIRLFGLYRFPMFGFKIAGLPGE